MLIGDARLAPRSCPTTSIPSAKAIPPAGDCRGWEPPSLHGWVQGRQLALAGSGSDEATNNRIVVRQLEEQNQALSIASVAAIAKIASSRVMARAGCRAESGSQSDAGVAHISYLVKAPQLGSEMFLSTRHVEHILLFVLISTQG